MRDPRGGRQPTTTLLYPSDKIYCPASAPTDLILYNGVNIRFRLVEIFKMRAGGCAAFILSEPRRNWKDREKSMPEAIFI